MIMVKEKTMENIKRNKSSYFAGEGKGSGGKRLITDTSVGLRFVALLFSMIVLCIPFARLAVLCHDYFDSIVLLYILTMTIIAYLFTQTKFVLFEPSVLFSLYYFTVVISFVYCINTNYSTNIFVNNTTFSRDIITLTRDAISISFIGYVSFILGYRLVGRGQLPIEIKYRAGDSSATAMVLVFFMLFVGIANFAINLGTYGHWNLVAYFKNISSRADEFGNGGTTLFYLFANTAMYILFHRIKRTGKGTKFFLFFFVINVLMVASTGRIFTTMSFLLVFISLQYYSEYRFGSAPNNRKYILFGVITAVVGVIFYYLRILSSISVMNKNSGTNVVLSFSEFAKQIGYYTVDKANIPNVGVLLKIIDSWDRDIGFLNGSSLVLWLTNVLPSEWRPVDYQPSVMIRKIWYANLQGGNLPPMGIGEMYANFGYLGPLFGMLILGAAMSLLYHNAIRKHSFWLLAITMQISINFLMIYPKGEFDNMTLWFILPIMISVLFIRFINTSITYSKNRDSLFSST